MRLAEWGSISASAVALGGIPERQISAWRRHRIPSDDNQKLIHEKLGIEPAAWQRQAVAVALARQVAAAAEGKPQNDASEAPGDPAADPVAGLREQVRRLTKALDDAALTQRSKNELEATLLRANAALAKCTSHALTEKEFRESHYFEEMCELVIGPLAATDLLGLCLVCDSLKGPDAPDAGRHVADTMRLFPQETAACIAANAALTAVNDARRIAMTTTKGTIQ